MLFNSPEFLAFLPIVFGLFWTGHVQSPVFSMRDSVAAGTMEVFKYSDTHLVPASAKIVGHHLNGVQKEWTKN